MRGLTIVIPSKTTKNAEACVGAVLENEPRASIVIVDDGVDKSMLPSQVNFVLGASPFIFSRNCNIGIIAAGDDDVVLLNDDALLKTPGGFSTLQRAAEDDSRYGVIASTCNNVGNTNQWPRRGCAGLREDPRMVCFVAVLIPRRTIDQVGTLDERFVDYGMDDDDYCFRVRQAGLKIGVHDGCFVDHESLTSTYRGRGGGDFRKNLELYKEKWGVDNHGRAAI